MRTSAVLAVLIVAPAVGLSTLTGTEWRVKLNVGLQPGSYLARTGWGASEARLILNTVIRFDDTSSTESEELVGPLSGTRVLEVQGGASKFISLDGEQEVTFTSGGWCVQRAALASKETEGLLRFWLDCPSGATKGDVTIDAGERIFFSTGIYDDAAELQRLVEQRTAMQAALAAAEEAKARRAEEPEGNLLEKALAFRARVTAEDEALGLRIQQQFFESLPSLGEASAAIATGPTQCGLSVKRQAGSGFMAKNVYHILGKFEMTTT